MSLSYKFLLIYLLTSCNVAKVRSFLNYAQKEKISLGNYLLITIILFAQSLSLADTSNTITREYFNFGHQLGYIYARMSDAFFEERGRWDFESGLGILYTSNMPLVRNPYWQKRTFIYIPLYFEVFPSNNISLQFEVTDLFVEFPYYDITSMGGKSPRFKTKIKLFPERKYFPAIALTMGVKFSSAKPYVIWRNDHNYDESNGLAGAGTGVADYLILFSFSKNLNKQVSFHSHLGLAPLGSPVEYIRGSAQADEIPYGVSLRYNFSRAFWSNIEVCGMYNGLRSTKLAHYSVARIILLHKTEKLSLKLNIQHGLTKESDEWGGGGYVVFHFKKR